jgi:hypothetical protein
MSVLAILARRTAVLAVGSLSIAGGAWVVAIGGGLVAPPDLAFGGATLSFAGLQPRSWTPIGATAMLVGLLLAALAVWPTRRARSYAIALPSDIADDGLVVRVTPATLTKLIRFEARHVNGVRDIVPDIHVDAAGWRVHCDLVVWRGASMRDVSESVTQRIRDALHRHTGINTSNLEIDVSLGHEPDARVD